MMEKRDLLFLTPVLPSAGGSGIAMRAHQTVKVFSLKYRVHIVILNFGLNEKIYRPDHQGYAVSGLYIPVERNPALILKHLLYKIAPSLFYLLVSRPNEWRYITGKQIKHIYNKYSNIKFNTIHIFRLYMAPFAGLFLKNHFPETIQLDLDDVESFFRFKLGDLYAELNDAGRSRLAYKDARLFEEQEAYWLPRMDRVFVCKETDKELLVQKYDLPHVDILPNVVDIPHEVTIARESELFTFLFVGVLDYFPNHDALMYFLDDIFPILKKLANQDFRVKIAGAGDPRSLVSKCQNWPEIEIIGYVPDIGKLYGQSDAVIVPLRVGGGTRIKILEAFSYKIPVITTSIGVEGIGGQEHVHYLRGDTPYDFAAACVQLIRDSNLRKKISLNGYEWVRQYYSPQVLPSVLFGKGRS